MQRESGFTLIELMIVVVIVGILAAIAIPQYQNYLLRSRWSDNMQAIAAHKQAISECMQLNAQIGPAAPPCDQTGSLAVSGHLPSGFNFTSGSYLDVAASAYASGVITLTGNSRAANCQVLVIPSASVQRITWALSTTSANGCTSAQTGFR